MNPRSLRAYLRLIPVAAALLVPAAHGSPFAYIANRYSEAVSVIDTATRAVVAAVEVGPGPMAAVVSPDGDRVYVSAGPQDKVFVIDTATNSVMDEISVGDNPTGIDISPDGATVYVVNTADRSLSIIDTQVLDVTATVALINHPLSVAVHPDGHTVYVSGDYPGEVSVVDTATNVVTTTIPVGDSLGLMAVHPTGFLLYVADSGNDELVVVNTATQGIFTRIPVGDAPIGVVVHPLGGRVYVTNLFGNDAVSVIDTGPHSVTHTITLPGPALAQGAALTPDGGTLYVALRGMHSVLAVDTANDQILGLTPVGGEPTGFGRFIGPDAEAAAASSLAESVFGSGGNWVPFDTPAAARQSAPATTGTEDVAVSVQIDLMPGAQVTAADDVIYVNNECIFVLDFDSGIETPITGRPDPADASRPICDDPLLQPVRHASVSRSRDRIVFNVGEDFGGQVVTKLFLIDLPSGEVFQLLPGFSRVGVGGIDFAPNGDIYTAGVSLGDASDPRVAEESEVFRITAALDLWEQVTDLPNRGAADISVSEDGAKLAFNTLVLTTNNIEVVETSLDGSNPKVVVQTGAVWLDSAHDPEHSPDSSRVVYSRMRLHMPDGSPCGPNWSHGGDRCQDLYTQSVDGGPATLISTIGDTSIVPDWKHGTIVYAFSRGDGATPGSWLGSMLTDENGFTLLPFGANNLFAKWIY